MGNKISQFQNFFDSVLGFINTFVFYYKKIDDVFHITIILLVIIVFIAVRILLNIIKSYLNNYNQVVNSFSLKTYRVSIPNNKRDDDEDKKKDLKQVLASLELFFYNLAGIEPQYPSKKISDRLKKYFLGRKDHIAIEIVNDNDDLITFYFSVPENLDQLLKQQIIGVWPDAFIEQTKDYDVFTAANTTIVSKASLIKNFVFPLKTYQNFETDPLDILLSSISKFTKGDGVIIQLLVRSSEPSWRKYGKKIVKGLNDGKSIEDILKEKEKNKFLQGFLSVLAYANGRGGEKKETQMHSLTSSEEELVKLMDNKMNKPGMDVNLRILISTHGENKTTLKAKIKNITDCFSQYGQYGLLNSYVFKTLKANKQKKTISDIIYRKFNERDSFVLCSEELITLFHLPLPTTDVPNIRWLLSRTAPAIFTCPEDGIIMGYNNYGDTKRLIKIGAEDRLRHTYVIGKSGTGKTSIMKDMAVQDILAGRGIAIIDPHGDFADDVLACVPKERAEDVIFFDPSDLERPFGLNLYEFDENFPEQKTLIINQFIEMLYTMYDKEQIGGPMFEYYTKGALALNMEDQESGNTMIEIPRVMADKNFRDMKLKKCKDPLIKNFWIKEAEKAGGDAALENVVPYITSKLNQFVQNAFIRNIVGQQKSTINFSDIMNTKKILICKFSKGEIGDMNSQLLGLIVTGRMLIAALERSKIPEKERTPFFLYIDECQNFLTPAITTILAEARKYGLGLILANQFITQLVKNGDTTIKDGIFGNAGTVVAFRISTEDAEFMEKQMAPVFSRFDLENSPSFVACAKTLMNNSATKPFTLEGRRYWTIYGDTKSQDNTEKSAYIKELSRLKYGRDKKIVDKDILSRLGVEFNENVNTDEELKKLFNE